MIQGRYPYARSHFHLFHIQSTLDNSNLERSPREIENSSYQELRKNDRKEGGNGVHFTSDKLHFNHIAKRARDVIIQTKRNGGRFEACQTRKLVF